MVRFPFSDLTASKLRPAVVLADAGRGDWILCQITSKSYGDPRAIQLTGADFASGSLQLASYVRPGKLFTAHASLVAGEVGRLRTEKSSAIRDAVVRMIQRS
jgi:mRNA interferase MazF